MNPVEIHLHIKEQIVRGTFPKYEGDYTVTPKSWEQTLDTERKSTEHDITVEAIPIDEVTNPAGGMTLIIE